MTDGESVIYLRKRMMGELFLSSFSNTYISTQRKYSNNIDLFCEDWNVINVYVIV